MQELELEPSEGGVSGQSEDDLDRPHRRFLWGLIVVSGFALWIRPLTSSLWMDELGTWWVVKDSFTDTIHRAWTFQGESPLYYAVLWATRQVVGSSELALRMPSLIAAVGAAWFMFLLAERLYDREFARLAVLAFVLGGQTSFQASNVRPYSFGLVAIVGSTFLLVRWLDTGRVSFCIGYVMMALFVAYAHYILMLVLVPQVVYGVVRARDGSTKLRRRDAIVASVSYVILVTPLAAQVASLWTRRSSLAIEGALTLEWFAAIVTPVAVVVGLLIGSLLASAAGAFALRVRPLPARSFLLLLSWLLLPLGLLALVSALLPIGFASDRYALAAAPAAVLLVAWLVRCVGPARARRIVAAALAITAVLDYGGPTHTQEDWRDAAAAVRASATSETVVLLHANLIESKQLDWYRDPERASYLSSPVSYYAMSGRILPVPYDVNGASETFVADELRPVLADTDRILYVSREPTVPFPAWLDGYLRSNGWHSALLGTFGSMLIVEFTPDRIPA
jgi:hypothetical protein